VANCGFNVVTKNTIKISSPILMECEHCGSLFASLPNLNRHIKTNKKCLALRNGGKSDISCEYCERAFSRKDSLQRHEELCSKRLDWYVKRTEELKKELVDVRTELVKVKAERDIYRDRCETLDKKSTTTTINNITNIKLEGVNISTIDPFTTETIHKRLTDFNFEMFSNGYRGIVTFARSIIIKEDEKNYVVTDPSRNAFHRLIESRDWKKDPNGMFLDILLDELRPNIYEHYDQVMTIMREAKTEDEREDADLLMDKTKPVYFGARGDRGSKDREELRQKLRNDIKKIVTI